MRDLTERALDTATSLGAGYADTRVVRRLDESIAIKTGRVEGVASNESEGFGVRVIVDGAWGFASSHVLSLDEADRVAAQAVRIAGGQKAARERAQRVRIGCPGVWRRGSRGRVARPRPILRCGPALRRDPSVRHDSVSRLVAARP